MKREIRVHKECYIQDVTFPLIAGDYNAYEFVMPVVGNVTSFMVVAKKQDGTTVVDTGTVEDGVCRYTLKTNMYDVPGEVVFRLSALSNDAKLTTHEIRCVALADFDGTSEVPTDRVPALTAAIDYARQMGDYAKKESGKLQDLGLPRHLSLAGTDGKHRIGEGGNSSGRTEIQNERMGKKHTLIIGEDELRYRIGTDLTEHKMYSENFKPTKFDVGLSKVDNTADLDKPVSKAQQAAVDALLVPISDTQKRVGAIEAYLGYFSDEIFGVEVDFVNKKFTRLSGAEHLTAGNDFDKIPCFGGRKRCNLTDDGKVVAYYGEAGFTTTGKLEQEIVIAEGVNAGTYAVGTPVQVMVEQPKFYYLVVPLKLDPIPNGKGHHLRKARYYISPTKQNGFRLHPAFVKDGVEQDFIYLSAFEGCAYNVSSNTYNLNDTQDVDWGNDRLSSVAKAKPTSGLTQSGATRNGFRTIAANRGEGWSQQTIQSVSATQLLFLIEYASFDMQEHLGAGVTNKSDDGKTSMAEITGATDALGNASGQVTNTNECSVVSYRGEENPFGNIWKWIDGINIYNKGEGSIYIADHGFKDRTQDAPYQDAGITISKTNGYVSAFAYNKDFDWLFLASEVRGNNKLPVGDFFYQDKAYDGYTVARLGGSWADGSSAGGFDWSVNAGSAYLGRNFGSRLLYVPNTRK